MQHLRILRLLAYLLAFPLIFTACTEDDPDPTPEPTGKYAEGFFVVNEGNFNDGDGSISFFNTTTEEVSQSIFATENGFPVGGTVQNMKTHNGNAYIMVNRASQVIVVDLFDFTETVTLTDFIDPFDFAAQGDKGYISVWGTPDANFAYPESSIAILDLTSNQVISSIFVGQRVSGMLSHEGKIYAAVEGGNEILIIDPATDEIETRIETPAGPSKMVVDANDQVWAICTSGAIIQLNGDNTSVAKTITGIPVLFYNEKFTINNSGTTLYWITNSFNDRNGAVYSLSTSADTPPANPLFTTDYYPYGIGVNPADGLIYVSEGNFGVSQSRVFSYSSSGILRDTFTAGRVPNGFVFQ